MNDTVKIRKRRGLTQERLAERAGLNGQTISYIERMKVWPDPGTLEKLVSALKIRPHELFMENADNYIAVSDLNLTESEDAILALIRKLSRTMAEQG